MVCIFRTLLVSCIVELGQCISLPDYHDTAQVFGII